MAKRQVEVFTAGCPLCDPTLQLIQEMVCPDCEVIVHDLRDEGTEKIQRYGIKTVPAVVVDGRLAACCQNSGTDADTLRAAGVGQPLT